MNFPTPSFKKFKAFTLVEMLIVIVIIGLLAAALIPKIVGMQARARDTSRKAHLNNLVTVIEAYYSDFGEYPAGSGSLATISGAIANLTKTIPEDPQNNRVCREGIKGTEATINDNDKGQFRYTRVQRNGIADNSFVVMACTEEFGAGSNRVAEGSGLDINETANSNELNLIACERIVKSGANSLAGCASTDNTDLKRYVIIQ